MNYDVVISGSDQVLNASFTLYGENRPTPAYYLQSFPKSRRIGYAVSFGCNNYPQNALSYAKKWINNFDEIGVREQTGLHILDSMGFNGLKQIVPDPTILKGKSLLKDIKIERHKQTDYICAYILRKHVELPCDNVVYIDDFNNPLSMEQWLGAITGSKYLITNSYHGMIVAILNHVPFAVIADARHMNDRFYSLLCQIGLPDRILDNESDIPKLENTPIDWHSVEEKLSKFKQIGMNILNI